MTQTTNNREDKNGHRVDEKGSLVFDERCRGCDAPKSDNRVERAMDEFDSKFAEIGEMRVWIEKTLTQLEKEVREELVEQLFKVEKEKWHDAEHCTCLGYALVEVCGGEDSEDGQLMEKRLLALHSPTLDN